MQQRSTWRGVSFALVTLATLAAAHGDHAHKPTPQEAKEPIDFWLWLHIAMEASAWAVLFPLAMVFGLVRHRWHVPLSTASVVLSLCGFFFGQHHGGRQFSHSVHGTFASMLFVFLLVQAFCGIYLKLHLTWKREKQVRPVILGVHGVLGRAFPVIGWTQMVFGIATMQGWCRGGHINQCLAHYIMGSAFTAYAVIMLIMTKCAVEWLKRRGFAQEYLDSWVILIWGIVNTFTEHQGGPWTHKDLQHTLMGVLWWTGGAVGVWISRRGARSIFPAAIIFLTGWAMSGHAQALEISTRVHATFGYTLMAGGICRIIEICFVLHDQPTGVREDRAPERGAWFPMHVFQYLPPFLLVCGGIMFMSATDEEMRWADSKGVDYVTWSMIDLSVAFALFFWFNVLIDAYMAYGGRYGLVNAPQTSEETPMSAYWPGNPLQMLRSATASHIPVPSEPAYVPETVPMKSYHDDQVHVLEEDDPFEAENDHDDVA